MSTMHIDIGFSEKKSPLSMREILTNRAGDARDRFQRAQDYLGYSPQRASAVNLQDLFDRYPEVNTETDVDIAADLLVQIFNLPNLL